jgi:hypothetical protein
MNTLIFGDVHGDAKPLLSLLSRTRGLIGPDAPLTIYSVGDLIDRGPDSKRVIDLCIQHGVRNLLGNHELWLHEWITTGKVNSKIPLSSAMGGAATLRSYGIDPNQKAARVDPVSGGELLHVSSRWLEKELDRVVPQEHREYIANGELWADVRHGDTTYFISHGGISESAGSVLWNDPVVANLRNSVPNPNRATNTHFAGMLYDTLFKVAPQQILWTGAKKGKVFRLPEGCVQVFGHTPWRGGAEIADHYVALDTGCGTRPPYRLSGLLLHADGRREILTCNRRLSAD